MPTSIEERIEKLEESNRRLRLMLVGVVALCVACVVTAGAISLGLSGTPDYLLCESITTKSISVVSDDSDEKLVWISSLGTTGGILTMKDGEGIDTVTLGGADGMGQIGRVPDVIQAKSFEVLNDDGVAVVTLRLFELGGIIETRNNERKLLFQAASNDGGQGTVTTYNGKGFGIGKGDELVEITATVDGEGTVTTYNGRGDELVNITANTDGNGLVEVMDRRGTIKRQLSGGD